MFKVGWVNNYGPGSHPGGSLRSQMEVVEAAPAGVEVVFCTPERTDARCHAYVLNSVSMFAREHFEHFLGSDCVVWAHDLWYTSQQWQRDERWLIRLMEGALRVAFLSPLHRDTFAAHVEMTRVPQKRIKLIPAVVNPEPFLNLDLLPVDQRPLDAFWMGTFDRYRFPRGALEWAMENGRRIDFYGFGECPPYILKNPVARYMGQVDAGQVPGIMAQYKACVYMPAEIGQFGLARDPPFVEACGRVMIEATLAGCKVVHNDRLGAATWGWFGNREQTVRAMREAPASFWAMFLAAVTREDNG